MFNTHLNNLERILKETSLDSFVHGCVCSKRRGVVYFKHPRLKFLVEHDIKAKQFKAAVRLLRLAASVDVLQLRLYRDYCLYNDRFNLVPDLAS